MKLYQITKYNPVYRNLYGPYQIYDWSSITDIGKIFDDKVLDMVEYFTTESMYIKAVKLIVNEQSIHRLYVNGFEKNYKIADFYQTIKKYPDYYPDQLIEIFKTVKDGCELSSEDAYDLCRLVLREHLFCKMNSRDRGFIITFGYDYSMRIICRELRKETINAVRDSGLFVEIVDMKEGLHTKN
jgi:hypothetical protein